MKAKVKATGKVVEATLNMNIAPVNKGDASVFYECSDGNTYLDTDLDFSNIYPDWQQVRIQAAICAMQGQLSNRDMCLYAGTNKDPLKLISEFAVRQADSLIEELRKGEVK